MELKRILIAVFVTRVEFIINNFVCREGVKTIFLDEYFCGKKLFDLGITTIPMRLVTSVKLLRLHCVNVSNRRLLIPTTKMHKVILICRNVSKKGDYGRLIRLFLGWINKFRMAVVTQPTRFVRAIRCYVTLWSHLD